LHQSQRHSFRRLANRHALDTLFHRHALAHHVLHESQPQPGFAHDMALDFRSAPSHHLYGLDRDGRFVLAGRPEHGRFAENAVGADNADDGLGAVGDRLRNFHAAGNYDVQSVPRALRIINYAFPRKLLNRLSGKQRERIFK
jgi:hypothetical protein